MVVWFRHGPCTVGIDDGLIPAADFATLTSLFEAARTIDDEAVRRTEAATCEIEQTREHARQRVESDLTAAREARERAFEEGYREGLEKGLAEWTERSIAAARTKQQDLERQTGRLGEIVSMAVDRVIEQEDRSAALQRALRSVMQVVRDIPLLTLSVPRADCAQAGAAVDAIVLALSPSMRIEVKADDLLPPGGCRFESELGIIDAGLPTQLAAIRRAVMRAAKLTACEAEDDAAHSADAPTAADEAPVPTESAN
jgi:type III secretion protein L